MMKKATMPYEVIYISAINAQTKEDGSILMLMALDDYSKYMHSPVVQQMKGTDEEFIGAMVKFFNGINAEYDRAIHAQSTTYYTDLPKPLHPLVSGMIMKDDELVYEPERVKQVFKPFMTDYDAFIKRKS